MMTFLLFLGIGLFIGTVIGAAVKTARAPGRGNWFLSAVCAIVVYWVLMLLMLLETPHLGIIPQEVKQNPFGLQAIAFNTWVFGISSLVAIILGVKLAPPGPKAFWIYSGAAMIWTLYEFVNDSSAAGRLMSVFAPVATLVGAMGAARLTRNLNSSVGSVIGKSEYRKPIVGNSLPQSTAGAGRSSPQFSGIANSARNPSQDKAQRDTSMWQRPAAPLQPIARENSGDTKDGETESRRGVDQNKVQRDTSMWQRPVNLPDNESK